MYCEIRKKKEATKQIDNKRMLEEKIIFNIPLAIASLEGPIGFGSRTFYRGNN